MNIYFGHCLSLIGTVNNMFYYRCFQICMKNLISRGGCFVSFITWLRNIIHYFFITDQKGCTWSLRRYSKLNEDIRLMVIPMILTYFLYVRVREWTWVEMKPFLLRCFSYHPAFTQKFFSLVRVFKSSSKQIEKRENKYW